MINPSEITWMGQRVGDMPRERLIEFVGLLNHQIAELARRIGAGEPLVTNDRPDPELDQTLSAVQDALTEPSGRTS